MSMKKTKKKKKKLHDKEEEEITIIPSEESNDDIDETELLTKEYLEEGTDEEEHPDGEYDAYPNEDYTEED